MKRPGEIEVVGVEPAENIARGSREALVQGVALTRVALAAPETDVGLVAANNLHGIIGRSPVDDDELKVRPSLVQDRQDAAFDERARVVGRHDDGNARRISR